jgi:hypothetical protein
MVAYACNPSTQEVEVGSLQIPGQNGLHHETLSQNSNKQMKESNTYFSNFQNTNLSPLYSVCTLKSVM